MTVGNGFEAALKGRKVFVTGHTGFTGGWACLWLRSIGATVAGFSLPADTAQSLFSVACIEDELHSSMLGDICQYESLFDAMRKFEPSSCCIWQLSRSYGVRTASRYGPSRSTHKARLMCSKRHATRAPSAAWCV